MVRAYRIVAMLRGSKLLADVHPDTVANFEILPTTKQVACKPGDWFVPTRAVDSEGLVVCRMVRDTKVLDEDGRTTIVVPKALCEVVASAEFLDLAVEGSDTLTMASIDVDESHGL